MFYDALNLRLLFYSYNCGSIFGLTINEKNIAAILLIPISNHWYIYVFIILKARGTNIMATTLIISDV